MARPVTNSEQSPIDIGYPREAALPPLSFAYERERTRPLGAGLGVEMTERRSRLTWDTTVYELTQAHLHHPAEHTIRGAAADAELHLVHKRIGADDIAVVGVLIEMEPVEAVGSEYEALIAPTETRTVHPGGLLPRTTDSFVTYRGSLTTPPYHEGVTWFVLDEVVSMPHAWTAQLETLLPPNARDTQPVGRRTVLARR